MKREVTQEDLMYCLNEADTFYKRVRPGHTPMLQELQALLRIVGIDESLERLKAASMDMEDAHETEVERYNREIDEQNRIVFESREKPWLPLYDGE